MAKARNIGEEVKELLLQGVEKAEIARRLQCSPSTVSYWVDRTPRSPDDDRPQKIEYLAQRVRELETQLTQTRTETQLWEAILQTVKDYEPVVSPPKPKISGKAQLKGILMFSDLHYGEIVSEAETVGISSYNPAIARKRVHRLVEIVAEILQVQKIRELHVFLLGDIISGDIHEELSVTNAAPITEQALQAGELIAEMLEGLGHYAKLKATGVVGNHGRLTPKRYHKQKQIRSMDWIAYHFGQHMTQKFCQWNIPRSPWVVEQVYSTKFLLIHGDQVKGWGGANLPWYGLTRDVLKRKVLGSDYAHDFHHVTMGHFHVPAVIPIQSSRCFINGALKGGDEYSLGALAAASRPAQMMLTVSPSHGVTSVHELYLE